MLSRPETFEVLMEFSALRVSSSEMSMSLSDELGVGSEDTGGSVNVVKLKTEWKYWLKRVAFL